MPDTNPPPPDPASIPTPPKSSKWLVTFLTLLVLVLTSTTIYFAYQSTQAPTSDTPTPQAALPTTTPNTLQLTNPLPTNTSQPNTNQYSYENFSISYPTDWVLSDIETDTNFPLKDRLSVIYKTGTVVALNKNGTYLIIMIEEAGEGGAGGLFLTESDFNDYISTRDKIEIAGDTFYVDRNHSNISSLLDSHGGAYLWGVMSEFIPDKVSNSDIGTVDGYEDVIKKNGYSYNFVVTSNAGGETNPELHQEILEMLKTIIW